MRFIELVNLLKENHEINVIMDSNSNKVTDIKLIDRNISKWDENTLYLGSIDNLSNKPICPIMLFCIETYPDLPVGSSCMQIQENDLNDIYKESIELIIEDLRIGSALFELAKSVIDKKSIVQIINLAAKIIGNALILVDSGNKILAHSTIYEIADPLWAENIKRGFCSLEFMQQVRSNKEMLEWNRNGCETKTITLPDDLQPKLVARIIQNSHVVGALIMIEHHTAINYSHLKQLPLIGNILFDTFNYDGTKGIQKSFNSTFLYNLLDERNMDNFDIFDISKTNFPEKMYVVVAQFLKRIENNYLKNTISLYLENIFPNGNSVRYKSYIAILVSSISEKQRKELTFLAKRENINIGISWPFEDILDFKRFFNQAVTCIKQAHHFGKTNQIFDYTYFSYYDLMYNYSGKIDLKNYIHPALKILKNYDTDFYTTLKTYLECNKNLGETSELLFIHRNTLNYRINRIKQLTGLNLENSNVIYSLIDSFRIEAFLESMTTDVNK
ncbi:hypothetical protein J2Z76_003018 [Sedimentibacter acidaminivorans]|uniref:PucR C-terminal helix-turn-helix domain-containing protein n=1 Tax=Sedimentibacter acidaminivorans TaxID=913099 RepID=A0ABS4GHG6_9FIRM|nr:helix-turn-helix domain-containing protein [Sedimentibacter acidaminivorans]MBP1927145.1 hypothetical protein [Sedimentibacter acidaminivorans]